MTHTTAAAAKNAHALYYMPSGPCKRGAHLGARHSVRSGCVECRNADKRRRGTSEIMIGQWHTVLADAIDAARAVSETQAWNMPPVSPQFSTDALALVLAHFVTTPRPRDDAPSVLTVAREIGQALDPTSDVTRARDIGAQLLGIASTCGFIAPLELRKRKGKHYALTVVTLSAQAREQHADIEARLAARDALDKAGPTAQPPPLEIRIARNSEDIDPPPQPTHPDAIRQALASVQGTAWRINPYMLTVLRQAQAAGVIFDTPKNQDAAITAIEHAAGVLSTYPEFYFPCHLDWRGRIYQAGRLQYTGGSDLARSLLEFAHGEPLNSDGIFNLGVYLATCHGVTGSFPTRFQWTMQHEAEILYSARNPADAPLWMESKHPYRMLAACSAWRQYHEAPTAPIHLPCAIDATSSAFQHFALLLRDIALAAKVNLAPSNFGDTPNDFYGDAITRSGANMTRNEFKEGAWFLYGQTGAKLAQTLAGFKGSHYPKLGTPARDAAAEIVAMLKQEAPGAIKLLDRLRTVARDLTVSQSPLSWTVPDGFTVRQAYREIDTGAQISVQLYGRRGTWTLKLRQRELLTDLDADAQINGLPPNLIHSLDACLLRAVLRHAPGLARWAVAHDSIATHPNHLDTVRQAQAAAIQWVYGADVLSDIWRGFGAAAGPVPEHAAALPDGIAGGWYTFS